MTKYSIAIDGPSGAGKSTLARMLAEALGFLYVDTGAIYRTVGLHALRRGVDPTDSAGVKALLDGVSIRLGYGEDGLQRMYLNGEDVTGEIRRNEISRYASGVSAIPEVRAFLLDMQRQLARAGSVIMDGRDIGTVVLPDADMKIFLTASSEARAARRWRELEELGAPTGYAAVLSQLNERDRKDKDRETAPLKAAEDAVVLDTTGLTLQESFEAMRKLIRERLAL